MDKRTRYTIFLKKFKLQYLPVKLAFTKEKKAIFAS
jgi:hypothetical protein